MTDRRDELDPPFEITEPQAYSGPVLFNSPHSGSTYPRAFLASSRLDVATLRRSEDSFVDALVAGVVRHGYPLMRAHFPRCFVDVNREPYELDPRMFTGRLPAFANTRSIRVAGGLGTIPRIVGDNYEIYAGRLSVEEGLERIAKYHKPYHGSLKRLLTRAQRQFGFSILLDCHSMPSISVARDPAPHADFVLGDRYGTSCDGLITDCVEAAARRLGYVVIRNKPYAGGYITEHYGNPHSQSHALQIEINRRLYIDERSLEVKAGFAALQKDLMTIVEQLMEIDAADLRIINRAAE
jgi:N-formylglutamate amidohydrolase